MKIGFVYSQSNFGMSIRIKAIREFLEKNYNSIKDIELKTYTSAKPATISRPLSYWLSPRMLNVLFKKACLGQDFSMFGEINQNERIGQLEKILEYQYEDTLKASNTVDVLHAETQIPAFVCSKIKEKRNIPYIFDMHGLLVEEMKQRGEPGALINFWDSIERRTVKNADHVIVVSHQMKEYVSKFFGKSKDQIAIVPNGSQLYDKKAVYRTPIGVIYGGVFDPYERVLDFVKTAEILTSDDYQFFLMGDGQLRNEIFDYINSKFVNIIYLGKKPRNQCLEIFCDMQIGVAPSTKDTVRKTASPIKVLDYAACGLPIVTVNAGEWSDNIKEYDCGIVVEDSDPKEFNEAIKELQNKDIWERKSANGRRMMMEKYNWPLVLQPLKELYHD
jgi:glycosyltransferase involved in cell wall biosynthesis